LGEDGGGAAGEVGVGEAWADAGVAVEGEGGEGVAHLVRRGVEVVAAVVEGGEGGGGEPAGAVEAGEVDLGELEVAEDREVDYIGLKGGKGVVVGTEGG
jgi:hypothetical protein